MLWSLENESVAKVLFKLVYHVIESEEKGERWDLLRKIDKSQMSEGVQNLTFIFLQT